MSLKKLFVLGLASLNACPDLISCCGNRGIDQNEASCTIEDLSELESLLVYHKNLGSLSYRGSYRTWEATLSNGKNIRCSPGPSNPDKVSCSLDLGVTETDGLRFYVKKDKDGKRTVSWMEIMCDNLTSEQLEQLKDMPENCDYVVIWPFWDPLQTFFTQFLLGAHELSDKKAFLDRSAKKIYGRNKNDDSFLFVWQDREEYRYILFKGRHKEFTILTDLRKIDLRTQWECDINDPEELKTILTRLAQKTKVQDHYSTVHLKETGDGSWYADLMYVGDHPNRYFKCFIFVNPKEQKCFCDVKRNIRITIHGIQLSVNILGDEKKTKRITWSTTLS